MIKQVSPNIFQNKHKDKKILLVGCGNSAAELIPFKKSVHDYFDVVIGCNKAFVEFDDIMDYHLVAEKITKANADIFSNILNDGEFNVDMPRLINHKGLPFFNDKKYTIIPITRSGHTNQLDLRSYESFDVDGKKSEGFYIGPVGSDKFSLGSVMLQALHLACIMGSNDIYMIGADMVFKNNCDHFYGDRIYRDKNIGKKANQHTIVSVNGIETTRYFFESAQFIDKTIITDCAALGIKVYDFSAGLISKANSIDIKSFFV